MPAASESAPPLPPLARGFAQLCKWQGLSPADLDAAGLPLNAGPEFIEETARKLGYKLHVTRRKLHNLPKAKTAVLLCLRRGSCLLLPAAPSEGAAWKVTWPEEVPVVSRIPGIVGNGVESEWEPVDLGKEYLGYFMTLEPDEAPPTREEDEAPVTSLKWTLGALSTVTPDLLFMLAASFCIHLVALGLPLLTMTVYNRVVPTGANETLWVLVSAAVAAYTFDFVVRILRGRFSDTAAKAIDHLLARRLIHHTLALELSSRPASAGNLAGRLRHYESVREFLTSATVLGLVDVPFAMSMTLLIFWLAGPVGWLPLAFGGLSLLVTLLLQPWQRHLLKESYAYSLDRQALTTEAINALETIKATNASGHMERRMMQVEELSAQADLKLKRISHFGSSFTAWSANLCTIAVIIVCVSAIQQHHLSMGGMIACVMVAGRAMAPLSGASGLLMRVQQVMVSLRSLRELLALPSENQTQHLNHSVRFPELRAVNASVTYPGQPNPSLREANLTIRPGERVGIIGRAGSGKTTLIRVLARVQLATAGQVLVDGLDISQLKPSALRAVCGYLPQDPVLMHGSLSSNLVMGRENMADDGAMLKAAQRMGVTEWANRHPHGFNMPVGERGVLLSGGERQMVAAARAILTEPDVLFLDEPTSSLDLTTEKRFCQALGEYLAEEPKRTLIMATHKFSLLTLVDRVILMEHGRVQLDGPRDEVLRRLQQGVAGAASGAVAAAEIKETTTPAVQVRVATPRPAASGPQITVTKSR